MLDPASIVNVAPPPPPQLIGALAVAAETNGSIGIIIGVIVSVIIALVLALVFTRRRRHLNEKRRKNVGLQVPNGWEAQSDEKGASAQKAKAESADEMVVPVVPKPTGATKAPVALKLQLDQLALERGFPTGATKAPEAPKLLLADQEGFELQNTPLVSTFLGMFTPKPVVVQNV